MSRINHKKRTVQSAISYLLFYLILSVVIVLFYKEYRQRFIMADDFNAINYYDYFTSGMNGLYPMIVLTMMPLLLNNFNAIISSEKTDKFYIQREGYRRFYIDNIKYSFIKGILLSLFTNLFIFITFSILDGFEFLNWNHIMFDGNMIYNFNAHQFIIMIVILEAIGMEVTNVALFMITRYKVNRYLYYLSVIFITALATTGVAAVFTLLSNMTHLMNFLNNTISLLLSIFSPLSLIFPTQIAFSDSIPFEIRATITFSFYILLLYFIGRRKYKLELKS